MSSWPYTETELPLKMYRREFDIGRVAYVIQMHLNGKAVSLQLPDELIDEFIDLLEWNLTDGA